jgi:glutaredoxin 3
MKIEIYTKDHCPYCVKAKLLLDKKDLNYVEIDVGNDPVKREELMLKSEGRRTVPQIFINNQPIGGCDDLYALEESGKLDILVNS